MVSIKISPPHRGRTEAFMKKYILALDEGTTSARAILFDKDSNIVSMAQHEIAQIYPAPGWVEQDSAA